MKSHPPPPRPPCSIPRPPVPKSDRTSGISDMAVSNFIMESQAMASGRLRSLRLGGCPIGGLTAQVGVCWTLCRSREHILRYQYSSVSVPVGICSNRSRNIPLGIGIRQSRYIYICIYIYPPGSVIVGLGTNRYQSDAQVIVGVGVYPSVSVPVGLLWPIGLGIQGRAYECAGLCWNDFNHTRL